MYFNNSFDKYNFVKLIYKYVDLLKIILCIFSLYINILENCFFVFLNFVCKIFDWQIDIVFIKKKIVKMK